ncbi:LCP family protein [Clostridium sp.]|uniref:LCP family protein n=1 Tax=Clostridium sp. TaxID=1506 RepID=UPI002FCBE0FA
MANKQNKLNNPSNKNSENQIIKDVIIDKGKKKSKFSYILLGVFFIVVILTTSVYAYLQSFSNNSVDLNGEKGTITEKEGKNNNNTVEEINKSANFLVVGVDNGEGDENNESDPRRTDTMMVVHYNYKDKKYDVLSIPRDTKVEIYGQNQKINAAHAIGEIPLAVDTVEELLNIKIDHYVKINTIAFREFIDALGGIDVVVDRNMYYDDPTQNLHINLKKSAEFQRLNGEQAEGFIRWRKNNDGTGYIDGDLGRIKHMQDFFGTVVDKLQSPAIITKIPSILSIFPKYIETNLNATDIMKYAMNLTKTQKENIKYHMLPGTDGYENGISYYFYDEAQNEQINAVFSDSEFVDINQQDIRIKIVNGTNKPGLATDFGQYIKKLGFTNYDVTDGKAGSESKITIYGLEQQATQYIKNQFGIRNFQYTNDFNEFYEVEIILGNDRSYINTENKN